MVIRRRAWLTREGWYYLAVLVFIIGGAVLRSVNLLVVLAGTLIAPPLFNWRLVMASLNGLAVRRRLPAQIVAGEPLTVEIEIANSRRWLSSWLIVVEDWIRHSGESLPLANQDCPKKKNWWQWLRRHKASAHTLVTHVPAGGSAIGTYRLNIFRRGKYDFGPLRVSTRFPLGLVRGQVTLPAKATMIVSPRLGRLLPAWASLLEAELAGDQRRHPQRGINEGDYYGLRPWQRGDSLRWVHWRTTAKLARPMVRQFERRKSRDVVFVLDAWLPIGGDEHFSELAISVTATALYDLTVRGHSQLALVIAGPKPEYHCGPASPPFCEELLVHLALVRSIADYNLSTALTLAAAEAPTGARVVVISSRSTDEPSLAAASAELSLDAEDVAWIDVSSQHLASLFMLT
jgi:uncharacterized protein (DUF58 family)